MAKEKNKASKKARSLWGEFKAFISRGNVLDMAVGVIVGGAFGAIVTALVNILLSLCTWGVPGGIASLITVLPAANPTQAGFDYIGQSFNVADLQDKVAVYLANNPLSVNPTSDLLSYYTKHGATYVWNGAACMDWGVLINAVISFIIIALVLFIIIKIAAVVKAKKAEMDAKLLEQYYVKHPEERPAPVEPGVPEPTTNELLTQIRDMLAAQKK